MARSTVDDLREILAYYKIQADDEAERKWKAKLEELHAKKTRAGA